MKITKAALKDLAERAAWSALYAAIGAVSVTELNLPPALLPVVLPALSAIKSFIAAHIGDPNSAALVNKDVK